jgi:hypothetical protein
MKKYIIISLSLIIGITIGSIGFYFYTSNINNNIFYNSEWKISKIQPSYEKYMTKERETQIQKLNGQIENEKFEIFRQKDWPQFKKEWVSYANKKIKSKNNKGYDFGILSKGQQEQSIQDQINNENEKIKRIQSDDREMVKEGFNKFKSGKAEWFDPLMAFFNISLYDDSIKIKDIQAKIRALKSDKNSYKLEEVGIIFRIEGKKANKVIACVFLDKKGEKLATSDTILFKIPPYQDEYLKGVYAKSIVESKCYTLN